ncbi:hypothetical protein FOMPIDRAFT_1016557 [Fomitopsis schrenkii]|uniref:Uncharacterized protein n=1 Tax=Fomitopsis schrenkii TaxID=2126942 RepID=S8FPM7_FOMSC|nr:hypothetical protein FOMPIDRAFT_1016557 [Fomitopsis schrenkii]
MSAIGYAGEKLWLEADILSTQAKCMRYKKDIRLKKRRAKKAYEDFKKARFRMQRNALNMQKLERRCEGKNFADGTTNRFGKLGYPKAAIEYGMKLPYDRGVINYLNKRIKIHKITDANWQVIRFVHEPDIVLWSCLVLQRFHGNIIDARMKLIESVYDDYKRTLRPIEWLRLPSVAAVCMVPSLRSLVFEDFDTPLDRAQCEETLRGVLPDVISTYRTSVKVLSLRALGETVQLQDGVVDWPAGADDRLALATSVFSRCNEHAFSHNGLSALLSEAGTDILHERSWLVERCISIRLLDARYHCDSDYLPRLDSRGRSIITGLATALGLNPDTARPEDFDSLDRRFFCQSETCGSKLVAMSWRDAVFHHGSSRTYCISMLDEASSATIRANDGRHYSKSKVWSCNHCCAHLNDWQSQAHVVEHVLTVHAVADAMDNVDYFRAAAPLYDYRHTVPLCGEKVSPVDGTYQDIVIECPEDEPRD